jgi:hypothetical protein
MEANNAAARQAAAQAREAIQRAATAADAAASAAEKAWDAEMSQPQGSAQAKDLVSKETLFAGELHVIAGKVTRPGSGNKEPCILAPDG